MEADVNDVACRLSLYARTSAPYAPCARSIAIHHRDTATLSPPIRRAAPNARRHPIVRCMSACTNHRIGAGAIIITAVALTALHESSTRAINAG